MYTYKITIAYDGTDYHGWQVQPACITIAQTLQDRFAQTFRKDITLIGASRTDAGVHALGQVARFALDTYIPAYTIQHAFNNALKRDILLRSTELVLEHFHPQRNVQSKTYWYHFFTTRPLPGAARYGYYYRFPLDFTKLTSALSVFVGTHDFRSFYTGDEHEDTIRTIHAITLRYFKRFNIYRIEVTGHSFLRYMIRRIIGAALHVAAHPIYVIADLEKALAEKNPEQPFPTAPAHGLILYKIRYNNNLETECV